ncbi:hypothetical protein ABMA28_012872 [Loxostege sticticalis]|uniref:DNA/RNA non-specific endonuclease/pyrophosphatase/phosphodiesterase domain-containing protein n=1 Tax=Loxostege sticticalis TaxID=481309 RepID=A0ABD0S2U7_LOXSC
MIFIIKDSVKILDCNLSLQDDFQRPTPVYIQDGHFLAPNNTGAISLRKSQTLLVACTGTRRRVVLGNETTDHDVVEAQCLSNNKFKVDKWTGPFKDIKCNIQPYFTSEEVKGGCGRGNKLYGVGYKVKEVFYSLYEACFDPLLVRTVYVRHEILPSSIHFHKDKHRPQFTEGGLFDKVKMSKLYALSNQKARINDLLGPNEADKYITKKEFLSRGHLAARADFSLRASQVATFHYVNTAPQWQRGNAGDWAALEEGLKRRIHALGRPVTVYTGTHGVLSFGDGKELYLSTDANNNGIVPVPLYLYKLVYDPKTKKAVVFVTINSSFYNSTMTDQLTVCEDVCERREFSWLTWRDDGTTSFCCSYEDAEELNLPKLTVSGLFH